jgi:hypothetical protein
MTQEQRNPLPAGRYWIEVSTEPTTLGTWRGFLSAFKGFVRVETTESDPDFEFSLFTTSKPLVWPDGIGFPNVAPSSIKSRADTVKAPDHEPDLIDQIPTPNELFTGVGNALTLVAVVVGMLVAVKLLAGRPGRKQLA